MPSALTITAAVITRNRCELLARTLPTVLEQDFPAGAFEVIVVDDGSTDDTPAFLARQSAAGGPRVLRQAQGGVSAARNAALGAARGKIVLFLDDDLLCEPGLLRAHASAHALGPHPLLVVGRVGVAAESRSSLVTEWLTAAAHAAHVRRSCSVTARDAVVAANCSAPRELLRASGGFDESFMNAREEHELGLRLVRAGIRHLYEPAAVALEVVGKSVEKLLEDSQAVGLHEVRLCRAYPEYRRHSPLARIAEAPRWKEGLRQITTRSRLAEAILLTAPARIATSLGTAFSRKVACALIGPRYGVALRRGAVTAAGSWQALTEEFGRRLPVLAYHRIGPIVHGANPQLTVVPANFERQLRLLRRLGYSTVTAAEWIAWCRTAAPLPPRPVLITFDDAYSDLGEYAFPHLDQTGYRGAVFAPSARLGEENIWDEALWPDSYPVTHPLLTARELLEWSRHGIEIGAHSRTHPFLPELGDADLAHEVNGSQAELECLLGGSVATFAYPFGAVDERVRDSVATAFDAAFTIEEGLNTLATDSLLLRRSTVRPSDSAIDVLFRLLLGWSPLHRLSLRLRRLRTAVTLR